MGSRTKSSSQKPKRDHSIDEKWGAVVVINRYAYLDSIRGIAALAVIYLHCASELLHNGWTMSAVERFLFFVSSDVFDIGKSAVVAFFAVSGFVIPYSLLKPNQKRPIISFVISRIFRLYPAYWLSIPVGIWAFFALPGVSLPLSTIIANIPMIQQFIGEKNIIGVYWTLQIELIFYAVCAIVFITGKLSDARVVFGMSVMFLIAALIMAVARYVAQIGMPVALPLALSVMFFGMNWRSATIDEDHWSRLFSRIYLSVFVIVMPVVALLAYNRDTGFGETWYGYTLSYYLALGLFVLLTTRAKLGGRVLPYLGQISYSVYLFGSAARVLVFELLPPENFPWLPGHVFIGATMLLSILVGAVTYAVIERPAIAVGRTIIARINGVRSSSSPAPVVESI